jgi:hypothetical protein
MPIIKGKSIKIPVMNECFDQEIFPSIQRYIPPSIQRTSLQSRKPPLNPEILFS